MISDGVMFHDNGEVFCCRFWCLLQLASVFSPTKRFIHNPYFLAFIVSLSKEETKQPLGLKKYFHSQKFLVPPENKLLLRRLQFSYNKRRKQINSYECDINSTRAENLKESLFTELVDGLWVADGM